MENDRFIEFNKKNEWNNGTKNFTILKNRFLKRICQGEIESAAHFYTLFKWCGWRYLFSKHC